MKKSELRHLIREAIKSTANEGLFGPSARQSKRDFKRQFPKSKGSAGEPGVTAASRSQDFGHSDSIISLVDNLTLTMGEDAFIAAVFKALPLEDAKRILRGITNDNPVHGIGGSPADIDDWLKENDPFYKSDSYLDDPKPSDGDLSAPRVYVLMLGNRYSSRGMGPSMVFANKAAAEAEAAKQEASGNDTRAFVQDLRFIK